VIGSSHGDVDATNVATRNVLVTGVQSEVVSEGENMFRVINLLNVCGIMLGRGRKSAQCGYFQEIVGRLYSDERADVALDLRLYEATGVASDRIKDIQRRVTVLHDADKIIAKMDYATELAA